MEGFLSLLRVVYTLGPGVFTVKYLAIIFAIAFSRSALHTILTKYMHLLISTSVQIKNAQKN